MLCALGIVAVTSGSGVHSRAENREEDTLPVMPIIMVQHEKPTPSGPLLAVAKERETKLWLRGVDRLYIDSWGLTLPSIPRLRLASS